MQFDDARARKIRARLLQPALPIEDVEADLARIADMARQEPSLACVLAECARKRRLLLRSAFQERVQASRLPGQSQRLWESPPATMSGEHIARCVAHAGCESLVATSMLELLEHHDPSSEWAAALIRTGGERGADFLRRMRAVPKWSNVIPVSDPLPFGIAALTSPVADVRRAALLLLFGTPRPVHLRALLLGVELQRYVYCVVLRERPLPPLLVSVWADLLVAHAVSMRHKKIPSASLMYDSVAEQFVYDLIDAGGARAPMETSQHLTPELTELADIGVAAYAARYMPDPRPTAAEREELERAEIDLVESAARLWG